MKRAPRAYKLALIPVVLSAVALTGCGGVSAPDSPPAPVASVSYAGGQVAVSARHGEGAPRGRAELRVQNYAAAEIWYSVDHTDEGVEAATFSWSGNTVTVEIWFKLPGDLAEGSYHDTVGVQLCHDQACGRRIAGSPVRIETTYAVTEPVPEPDVPPLQPLSRIELGHDVVDAAYSAALDAIVMASAHPVPALQIHYPATGARQELLLSRAPTALSLAPDGLSAAVGHAGLITYVELTTAGEPGPSPPVLLDVSANVWELVLDGRGYAHVFLGGFNERSIHSVEIASNTEVIQNHMVSSESMPRLHPSGDYIYVANRNLSPSTMRKFDIRSGMPVNSHRFPYHSEYPVCENLWMKQDGEVIYSGCGRLFLASEDQAQDMLYAGSLARPQEEAPSIIHALSQSDLSQEIILLESDPAKCRFHQWADCYTHFSIYGSDDLQRVSRASLAPIRLEGRSYAQRGDFVFQSADGLRHYMISRLINTSGPPPHYLNVLR